ncbi:MAG TPA: ATP-binding cassette domain-containing protein [Blastocatellia bacterium]|nr:ATP-binding cassette domain-containing protein [Blastocatellia bacterium]
MLQVSIGKQIGTGGKQLRAERQAGSGNNGRETGQPFRLDVEFTAPSGVTILFGHSGSGKTTCLRAVAGIVTPDEGRISLDERLYFDSTSGINLPIQQRRVGFVFQDYVLFPHLTAEQNVAYGIRTAGIAGQSKAAKRERARESLSLLGIEYAARQYPRELSGGESQRVALARALASDPAIVLLDEPLSAVDAKTRARLLVEIKATQQRTAIPFLYVTHNVAEVVEIGDYVIVLNEGRVIRQGSPREITLVQV